MEKIREMQNMYYWVLKAVVNMVIEIMKTSSRLEQ